MYRQVSKLQPGRWIERRIDGTISEHVYWDPVKETIEQERRPADIEELRQVLKDSYRGTHGGRRAGRDVSFRRADSSLITVLGARAG